jgi:hypothetical protein
VKSFAKNGSSGKAVHRIFCSECGSPIAHDPDAAPEIIAIKAGTLDTDIKRNLKPVRAFRRRRYRVKYANYLCLYLGYGNLDRQQASFLPGAPGQAFRAHAPVDGTKTRILLGQTDE